MVGKTNDNVDKKTAWVSSRESTLEARTRRSQMKKPAESTSENILDKLAAEIRRSWIQEHSQLTSPGTGSR